MSNTFLYQEHLKLGAKMVDFASWQMPLQYEGILVEHEAVRKRAGLFDVSHMGAIHIKGDDAEPFVSFLSANHIAAMPNWSAIYTVLCNEFGGSVDDTLVYKLESDHFFIVANASNRLKDLEHLQKHAKNYNVSIEEHFQNEGILALQGPQSIAILSKLFPNIETLQPMKMQLIDYQPVVISSTGYTGEKGFEIFAPNELLLDIWSKLVRLGVKPCGLGARDTLRLEKGYALYGHELNDTISPKESVASWVVKNDHDFLGKQAIEQLLSPRKAYGLRLKDNAIARDGFLVFKEAQEIGKITSGNFSPSLKCPIALCLSHQSLANGDEVHIKIREQYYSATVVPLPFI